MKLMKSFLTLLLLGGMTFAGCNKKSSEPSGGGEEGGGGSGGGEVAVDHFGDKKIVVESQTVTPPEAAEDVGSMVGSYISFFKADKSAELVQVDGEDQFIMVGSYTVNEAGTAATISAEYSYDAEHQCYMEIPIEMSYVINYDAASAKYSMEMSEEDVTIVCVGSAAAEAPEHAAGESALYVFRSTDDENWSKTRVVLERITEMPYVQAKCVTTFAENEEFAIDLSTNYGGWKHFEDYSHSPDTAGGKVVEGKENTDHSHNFKITEAGEYAIYINFMGGSVYIVHETTVAYSLWLNDGWVYEADSSAHPDYYLWVWTAEDAAQEEPKPGLWMKVETTEFTGGADPELFISVELSNNVIGAKLLRCEKDAATNPVAGSTSYGSPVSFNATGNIDLSRTGGDIPILFDI